MKGLFVATYDQFIKPIIERLRQLGGECVLTNSFPGDSAPLCDYIWVDFATEEAIKVQNFVTPAKKILRIHAFEAYSDIIKRINPKEWHKIIFVNPHIATLCQDVWEDYSQPNLRVIPNYIDVDALSVPFDKPLNNKIAYAGYFTRKKGIGELYLLASALPEYEFHLAGTPQEPDLWHYMLNCKPKNVTLYPWQPDMQKFLEDKTYYINASVRESFCVSAVEAMCCGVCPVIRDWLGAEHVYPKEYIWSSLDDVKRILKDVNKPQHYREAIITKLNLRGVIEQIVEILGEEAADIPAPTVTVGIVQTRRKYLNTLLNSLSVQGYPITIDILDNMDRSMSIGKAYNTLADRCDTDLLLYVGDDDILAEDYVLNVVNAYMKRQHMYPGIVGIVTGAIPFEDTGKKAYSFASPTGFWKPEFVRRVRFDETLVRQVDTEFMERMGKEHPNDALLRLDWVVGYYYRQHDKNISGNKFVAANTSQDPVKE